MRRSDIILYAGILILFLGLVSWYVSQDRLAETALPTDAPAADDIPEIPHQPATAVEPAGPEERNEGLVALVTSQFESIRREGDRLADRVWKDGLSDGQRGWLISAGDRLGRLKDFTLSLQFLLILLFTGMLVGLYHLVSSGKLLRLIRRSS